MQRIASPSAFLGWAARASGYISSPLEREGLIVVVGRDAEGKLASIEMRAVVLDRAGLGAVPSVVSGTLILDRFLRLSAEFSAGSYEENFYSEVSRGWGESYLRDMRAAFRSAGVRGLAVKASRLWLRHGQTVDVPGDRLTATKRRGFMERANQARDRQAFLRCNGDELTSATCGCLTLNRRGR
jgi:hypothetical protein